MSNSAADGGIPLLTEILLVPSHTMEVTAPAAVPNLEVAPLPVAPALPVDIAMQSARREAEHPMPAEPAFAPESRSLPLPPLPQALLSAQDWEQLEADITGRISRQVLSRIDFVLEQRVRDSLSDVLQIAVEGLAQQIQHGLHQTLEDVIARAVAQEIARLQTSKN